MAPGLQAYSLDAEMVIGAGTTLLSPVSRLFGKVVLIGNMGTARAPPSPVTHLQHRPVPPDSKEGAKNPLVGSYGITCPQGQFSPYPHQLKVGLGVFGLESLLL